jgi:hypothetical protein
MAKQLESIEIIPGEKGGHRVVHNFKRETGKKSGAMNGDLYMERPKSEEHPFLARPRRARSCRTSARP